jgi:hypothetical protein
VSRTAEVRSLLRVGLTARQVAVKAGVSEDWVLAFARTASSRGAGSPSCTMPPGQFFPAVGPQPAQCRACPLGDACYPAGGGSPFKARASESSDHWKRGA